jgi:hypothetical protein
VSSTVRHRVVFGTSVAVFGALAFVVASAFVVDHHLPKVLAAIVGAFTFPVAPVAWHAIGERRRAKRRAAEKTPAKAMLTGIDRFWLRFATVVLVVIGPMVAYGRFGVVRAAWHHALWFIPEHVPSAVDAADLKRVPGEAELVVTMHHDGAALVSAWGDGQAMIAAEGKLDSAKLDRAKLREVTDQIAKTKWLHVERLAPVMAPEDTLVAATDAWQMRVAAPAGGPSAQLVTELARAPKTAALAIGFVPKTTRDVLAIRTAALWVTTEGEGDKNLVIEGRLEARSPEAAAALVAMIKAALAVPTTAGLPESCREPIGKLVDLVHLTQSGAVVTVRAELTADVALPAVTCVAGSSR